MPGSASRFRSRKGCLPLSRPLVRAAAPALLLAARRQQAGPRLRVVRRLRRAARRRGGPLGSKPRKPTDTRLSDAPLQSPSLGSTCSSSISQTLTSRREGAVASTGGSPARRVPTAVPCVMRSRRSVSCDGQPSTPSPASPLPLPTVQPAQRLLLAVGQHLPDRRLRPHAAHAGELCVRARHARGRDEVPPCARCARARCRRLAAAYAPSPHRAPCCCFHTPSSCVAPSWVHRHLIHTIPDALVPACRASRRSSRCGVSSCRAGCKWRMSRGRR